MTKAFIILMVILTAIVVYVVFIWEPFSIIPSPHSLVYDGRTFDPFAKQILQQHQITDMDDCTRHTKRINGVRVAMINKTNDKDDFEPILYYQSALDSLHIDHALFADLRNQLEDTQLREFHRSGDSILFFVDGFLDHGWGFLYCDRAIPMDTTYFDFHEHSVRVIGEVNKHWKNVSIH